MPDLTHLTPAPWRVEASGGGALIPNASGYPMLLSEDDSDEALAALQFAAMARNAEDVLLRHEYLVAKDSQGWAVFDRNSLLPTALLLMRWDHPFIALVEADKWLTEQEAKR